MKNRRRYIIWLGLCMILSSNMYAQDFVSDFEQINAKYKKNNYSMNLTYQFFDEVKNTKPDRVMQGIVRRNQNQYYVKLDQSETIISNGVFLQVNHAIKAILLDSSKPAYYQGVSLPIDSLEGLYEKVKFEKVDSQYASYTIHSRDPKISHTRVVYDQETFSIKEIQIFFFDLRNGAKEGAIRNKLIVKYGNVNFNPTFNPTSFSQGKYIRKEKSTYKVVAKYKNYGIVNNL